MELLLKNGYVVDSANGFEGNADILVHDGIIREVGSGITSPDAEVIDCTGLTVIPGICDMHVHFRDPGQTHKEDIITGGNAAELLRLRVCRTPFRRWIMRKQSAISLKRRRTQRPASIRWEALPKDLAALSCVISRNCTRLAALRFQMTADP